MKITVLPIQALRPHERVRYMNVLIVLWSVWRTGTFTHPILVDRESGTILDGHHRYFACRLLGCSRVPCYVTDYHTDTRITVGSWRPDYVVTKELVTQYAQSGKLMPHKTSRHFYPKLPSTHFNLDSLLLKNDDNRV